MCDPTLIACAAPCPCWAEHNTLGHSDHCCFLRDTRDPSRGVQPGDWRTGEDECQPPATVPAEPPC